MKRMKDYQYFDPHTLEEAFKIMQAGGSEVIPVAGGTDVLPDVLNHKRPVGHILNLTSIKSISGIRSNGSLRIGATTTFHQIHTSPLVRATSMMLAEAAGQIGSRQIQNLATLGGNVCTALPGADSVPPLVAAGAELIITSLAGERRVAVEDFITGPRQTLLEPGELVTEFFLPVRPPGTGTAYLTHTTLKASGSTVVGVAVSLTLDLNGRVCQSRIALGNCSSAPLRAHDAELFLKDQRLSEGVVFEAARITAESAKVEDSLKWASVEYRRELVRVLTSRAIHQAESRARSGSGEASLL
jgi:aerobic carbon-monoxide dehydrogenase medium subunit